MRKERYNLSYKNQPLAFWLTPLSPDQVKELPGTGDGRQPPPGGEPPDRTPPVAENPGSGRKRRTRPIVGGLVLLAVIVTVGTTASLWRSSPPSLRPAQVLEFPQAHTLAGGGPVDHLEPGRKYQGRLPGYSKLTTQPVVFQLGIADIRHCPLHEDGTFAVKTSDDRGVNYFLVILPTEAKSDPAAPESWFGSAAQQQELLRALQSAAEKDDDQFSEAKRILKQSFDAVGAPFTAMSIERIDCAP